MDDARDASGMIGASQPVSWRWGEIDAVRGGGDDVELTHRQTRAQLSVRNGRLIRGDGYAATSPEARHDLARVGAIVRLRQRGRYLVHATGAVDPRGRAWLLAGDSGCGKSTLGYALTRAGWTSLGDDGVVIEGDDTDFRAHAWREPLKVSLSLAGEFPELNAERGRVRLDDPRRRMGLSVAVGARGAPIVAIVFLSRATRCAMRRVSPVVALGALVRQSPWVIIEDAHAAGHLDALRRAAALPVFHLEHTSAELHTIAALLTTALA
jgi:hypothetical protein